MQDDALPILGTLLAMSEDFKTAAEVVSFPLPTRVSVSGVPGANRIIAIDESTTIFLMLSAILLPGRSGMSPFYLSNTRTNPPGSPRGDRSA